MRPSVLLLVLACGVTAFSVAAIALPAIPPLSMAVAWAALCLAVIADAVITPGGRRFALHFSGPHEVFVGEAARFTLRLDASGGRYSVRHAVARLRWPEGVSGPTDIVLAAQGQSHALADFTARATKRGRWRIAMISVLRASRLGLIEFIENHPQDIEISVVPNIRSITSGELDTEIASMEFGERATSIHGEGSEFHQLREFVAGMDTRTIDYKRSARHGALVARQMQTERNHSIVLALDNGHLMREEVDGLAKIDHMINAGLALAWAGILGGDRVGLYAFDARPRLFVPPMDGRRAFAQLRSHTASLEYRLVETNHTLALSHLHQRLSRRSLVVVFSDFVDTTTAELLLENVQVLNRHHVVIFVTLRDPLLERYHRRQSDNIAMVAETVAAADLERERRRVLDSLLRLGVFVIETTPGGLRPELLSTYMTIRSRELI